MERIYHTKKDNENQKNERATLEKEKKSKSSNLIDVSIADILYEKPNIKQQKTIESGDTCIKNQKKDISLKRIRNKKSTCKKKINNKETIQNRTPAMIDYLENNQLDYPDKNTARKYNVGYSQRSAISTDNVLSIQNENEESVSQTSLDLGNNREALQYNFDMLFSKQGENPDDKNSPTYSPTTIAILNCSDSEDALQPSNDSKKRKLYHLSTENDDPVPSYNVNNDNEKVTQENVSLDTSNSVKNVNKRKKNGRHQNRKINSSTKIGTKSLSRLSSYESLIQSELEEANSEEAFKLETVSAKNNKLSDVEVDNSCTGKMKNVAKKITVESNIANAIREKEIVSAPVDIQPLQTTSIADAPCKDQVTIREDDVDKMFNAAINSHFSEDKSISNDLLKKIKEFSTELRLNIHTYLDQERLELLKIMTNIMLNVDKKIDAMDAKVEESFKTFNTLLNKKAICKEVRIVVKKLSQALINQYINRDQTIEAADIV